MQKKLIYIYSLLVVCFPALLKAQNNATVEEKKCYDMLDKALGKYLESDNMAIYFESIAFDIKDPEKIFSLPVYKVYKGGYMFILGKKYEIQVGTMKALCDGKLSVFIDETQKVMLVDSLNHINPSDSSLANMEAAMSESINDATLSYVGEVTLQAKKYHKIKAVVSGKMSGHVLYYIDVTTGQMFLMAEYQNNTYTAYQFGKIAKVPAGHEFGIQLPKKEIQSFYGYEVIDNRFLNSTTK